MEGQERTAMEEVLSKPRRHINAARDTAGTEQWQGMSWTDRLRTLSATEPPPPPATTRPPPATNVPFTSLETELGLQGTKDRLFYNDTVQDLYTVCVALQKERPPTYPDRHLPNQGDSHEKGLRYPSFVRAAQLIFEDEVRMEQVEFVWEKEMNPTGARVGDLAVATLDDLKRLLDTLGLHLALAQSEVLVGVARASFEMKKDLRDQRAGGGGQAGDPQGFRKQMDAADAEVSAARVDLERLGFLNAALRREVGAGGGVLPLSDLDKALRLRAGGRRTDLRALRLLCDLVVPGTRHAVCGELWRGEGLREDEEAGEAGFRKLLLAAAERGMVDEAELAQRVHRASNLGLRDDADAAAAAAAAAAAQPPHRDASTVLARRRSERDRLHAQVARARDENSALEAAAAAAARRAEAAAAEREAAEAALRDPEEPPPETPDMLWVTVGGGWRERGPGGVVRPGRHGAGDKLRGRFDRSSADGAAAEEWRRDATTRAPAARIASTADGVWAVYVGDGAAPLATMVRTHGGWRPHEVEGGWEVAGDSARVWHVEVAAVEPRGEGSDGDATLPREGLCRTCVPVQHARWESARVAEGAAARLRADAAGLAAQADASDRRAADAFNETLLLQDGIEAPAMRDRRRVWGTEGTFSGTPAQPLWTGGRPQTADEAAYVNLRARGGSGGGGGGGSRMSAVYAQLDSLRQPSAQQQQQADPRAMTALPFCFEQMSKDHPLQRAPPGAACGKPLVTLVGPRTVAL